MKPSRAIMSACDSAHWAGPLNGATFFWDGASWSRIGDPMHSWPTRLARRVDGNWCEWRTPKSVVFIARRPGCRRVLLTVHGERAVRVS
jgi:hypothetical protein